MIDDIRNVTNIEGAMPSIKDDRDKKVKELISCARRLPSEYDNGIDDFVLDQGKSNMCVACSLSLIRYWQEKKQSNNTEKFSPAYIYANRSNKDYKGEGMQPREALKTLTKFGIPYMKNFPGFYTYAQALTRYAFIKDKLDELAYPNRISKYYRIDDPIEAKNAIMDLEGISVMIPVYDCLYDAADDGTINYDENANNVNYGYHQVTFKGWTEKGWILQNSWGEKWGNKGKCILPYNYPIVEVWACVDEIYENNLA